MAAEELAQATGDGDGGAAQQRPRDKARREEDLTRCARPTCHFERCHVASGVTLCRILFTLDV
eukprot:5663168-Prymnesium_polylepis.1